MLFVIAILLFVGGLGTGGLLAKLFQKQDTTVEEVVAEVKGVVEEATAPMLVQLEGVANVNDKLTDQPAACVILSELEPEDARYQELQVSCDMATCWRTLVAEGGRAECGKLVDVWSQLQLHKLKE